jgi:hypothetical protein
LNYIITIDVFPNIGWYSLRGKVSNGRILIPSDTEHGGRSLRSQLIHGFKVGLFGNNELSGIGSSGVNLSR